MVVVQDGMAAAKHGASYEISDTCCSQRAQSVEQEQAPGRQRGNPAWMTPEISRREVKSDEGEGGIPCMEVALVAETAVYQFGDEKSDHTDQQFLLSGLVHECVQERREQIKDQVGGNEPVWNAEAG